MTNDKSLREVHQSAALPAGYLLHWYEIKSLIGRGAFGMTYLAVDTNLHKHVAIKEYLPRDFAARHSNSTIQPLTHERGNIFKWGLTNFLKEARILARFTHPNIISVMSVFELNNTAYMVMEYEKGDNLSTVLQRQKRFTQKQLLDITLPLLDGLKLVHSAGFVHRDIKPSNIYLRENYTPVLLDFGSARQAVNTNNLTSILTQGYSPLEQYENNPAKQGPWTDIYAFGATLYYCVSGKRPVDAITRGANLLKGGQDVYVSIFQRNDGSFEPYFLGAIDAALRFNIEDRPQNTQMWKEMLSDRNSTQDFTRNTPNKFTAPKTLSLPLVNIDTSKWPCKPSDAFVETRHRFTSEINLDSERFTSGSHYQEIKPATTATLKTKPLKLSHVFSLVFLVLITIGIVYSTKYAGQIGNLNANVKTGDSGQLYDLLAMAQQKLNDAKYSEPANDSALFYYKKVLDLDAKNIMALSGINQVIQFLINDGRANLKKRNYSKVEECIQTILAVSPGNPMAVQLNTDMKLTRTNVQEIKDLNKLAQGQFRNRIDTDASKEKALKTYVQILNKDPKNFEAKRGIRELFEYYSTSLYELIESKNYEKLNEHYLEIAALAPGSKFASDLKTDVDKNYAYQFDAFIKAQKFDEADELIVAVKSFTPRSNVPRKMLRTLTLAQQEARTIRTIVSR